MDQARIKQIVKVFVKNFSLLLTESGLYPPQHPDVVAQTQHTVTALEKAFNVMPKIYLDIFEGQFAHEGIPLYELKHTVEKTVQMLDLKDIKCICFKIGLSPQHLSLFVYMLTDKIKHLNAEELHAELGKANIANILVEKKRFFRKLCDKYAVRG